MKIQIDDVNTQEVKEFDTSKFVEIKIKTENQVLKFTIQDFSYSELHLKLVNEGFYKLEPIVRNTLDIKSVR